MQPERTPISEACRLAFHRQAFGEFGETALLMMINKGSGDPEQPDDGALTKEEFAAKYGATKVEVNFALIRLQVALESKDFDLRNRLYDFFIELLRKI